MTIYAISYGESRFETFSVWNKFFRWKVGQFKSRTWLYTLYRMGSPHLSRFPSEINFSGEKSVNINIGHEYIRYIVWGVRKRLKSGLPIRYSLYSHVRYLYWPTFHLKHLFQTENVSNLDSAYDIPYIYSCPIFILTDFSPENLFQTENGSNVDSAYNIAYIVMFEI